MASVHLFQVLIFFLTLAVSALADDASKFLTWKVAYLTVAPLGVEKQVVTINGQFPGPQINAVTNDILVINVFNYLDEPLLMHWNGIWQRRTSWQDGVPGTQCSILPGRNFTYQFQVKDQIGSYFYFPSTGFLKGAGGYGGLKIDSRPVIPIPYKVPYGDLFVLIGDWFNADHRNLKATLDAGGKLGFPDGVLINGKGPGATVANLQPGKTYLMRISNVGIATSLNFRIQGHKMRVVETEGSHTVQNLYSDLDIHVGQSYSVLITLDQAPGDYYMVASTRFTKPTLTGFGVLHYTNSRNKASGPLPGGPTVQIDYSLNQARTIRWNLTANAARPNPQGSFHYGLINVSRTIILAGSQSLIANKQHYLVNSIAYKAQRTPLKLADYFKIPHVFSLGSIPDSPIGLVPTLKTSVLSAEFHSFVEIVFQNYENVVNSWHIDGYSAFVVGMDGGQWLPSKRKQYNLFDAIYRSTVQVYPQSWTAVLLELDNVGMWNIRSQIWERAYQGQQLYMRIVDPSLSVRNEAPIPDNVLLCSKASHL